jgi:hypothetical protein
MMDGDKLEDESLALLDHFEERGLEEAEACAVMGVTLESLITEKDDAARFVALLAKQLGVKIRVEGLN